VLLLGYAKTLIRLHRLLAKDEQVNPDDLNELAAKTREYLERALHLDPNDTLLLYERKREEKRRDTETDRQ
jgi:hypothetical protein